MTTHSQSQGIYSIGKWCISADLPETLSQSNSSYFYLSPLRLIIRKIFYFMSNYGFSFSLCLCIHRVDYFLRAMVPTLFFHTSICHRLSLQLLFNESREKWIYTFIVIFITWSSHNGNKKLWHTNIHLSFTIY